MYKNCASWYYLFTDLFTTLFIDFQVLDEAFALCDYLSFI